MYDVYKYTKNSLFHQNDFTFEKKLKMISYFLYDLLFYIH